MNPFHWLKELWRLRAVERELESAVRSGKRELESAIRSGNTAEVERIAASLPNVLHVPLNKRGDTALFLALFPPCPRAAEVVGILIKHGANVNARDGLGTPLQYALAPLCASAATLVSVDPLVRSEMLSEVALTVAVLIKSGADVNAPESFLGKPLKMLPATKDCTDAVMVKVVETVRSMLLKKGARD